MKVEDSLNNNPSIPIINLIPVNKLHCLMYLPALICDSKLNVSVVKKHKEKLGKQKYCWCGEFKYWIWELPYTNPNFDGHNYFLRIFVSNQKGISIEVGGTKQEELIMSAYQDYYDRMTK